VVDRGPGFYGLVHLQLMLLRVNSGLVNQRIRACRVAACYSAKSHFATKQECPTNHIAVCSGILPSRPPGIGLDADHPKVPL